MEQSIASAPGTDVDSSYSQCIDGCRDGAIGGHGLGDRELDSQLNRLRAPLERLKAATHDRSLELLTIPETTHDITEMREALRVLSEGARTIVFFGTGGSSLGGQTLAQLGGWNL